MKKTTCVYLSVLVMALVVNLGLAMKLGVAKPMTSDSQFYLLIAKSLAAGDGYFLREGFWPAVPTMTRSPAWPFAVSLILRAVPGASPDDVVMRVLALMLNSLVAVLVALLVKQVVRKNPESRIQDPECRGKADSQKGALIGLIAGVIYILHPQALYLAYGGASEILFLVLALGGAMLLLGKQQIFANTPHLNPLPPLLRPGVRDYEGHEGERKDGIHLPPLPLGGRDGVRVFSTDLFRFIPQACGILLLGLSCLARPNFLLFIGFMGLIVIVRKPKNFYLPRPVVYGLLSVVLFLTPSFLWAVRNYQICGYFPVLSTLRGQTFYGGNNEVVARDREQWGYWVFPNAIPGEIPMVELSKRMSEYEVDAYYNKKGAEYVQAHRMEMPRLWLGKLIRAYWPLPWKSTAGGYVLGLYRGLLYLMAMLGLFLGWKRVSQPYLGIVAAMVLANLATVMVFWGCSRFAFAVEPFLIPLAVIPVMLLQEKCRARRESGAH